MSLSNKELIELVVSLSPKEKQFFKRQFKSGSDFIYLFDFINKYKFLEKEKFEKFLNKRVDKKKKITPGHLSVIKSYLKEKIMESLRSQYIAKRKPYASLMRAMNSDILMEKGLYQLSHNELQEAKKLHFEAGFPIEQLLLLRRESILFFYNRYKITSKEELEKLFSQRIEVAKELLLEVEYSKLLSLLSLDKNNGRIEKELGEKLGQIDFFKSDFQPKSMVTQYLYFWNKALLERLKKNHEKAVDYFSQSIQIWLDYPIFIETHPRMFLGACSTYLDFLNELGRYDKVALKTIDLNFLLNMLAKTSLAEDEKKKLKGLFLLYQLIEFSKNRQYEAILEKEKDFQELLQAPVLLPDSEKISFSFFFAYAYFKTNQLQAAQNVVHLILENKALKVTENLIFYSRLVILNLLIHFDMGNIKFLHYEVHKSQKLLQSLGLYRVFEIQFFKMFSKLLSKRYTELQDYVFEQSIEQLEPLLNQENIHPISECNAKHLLDWIDFKISLEESSATLRL